MKISIDVEATSEEVRDALGLPDVKAVQDRLIERMEEKVESALNEYDPMKLLTMFLPEGFRSVGGLGQTILDAMPTLGSSKSKKG